MNANDMTWGELTEKQAMAEQGIAVDIRNVNKRYTTQENTEVTALHDINLQIKEHDFICVVGRSGCGKTTLLNMLAGFEKPSDGEIIAQGRTITGPSPRRRIPKTAAIPVAHRSQKRGIRHENARRQTSGTYPNRGALPRTGRFEGCRGTPSL